VEIGGLLLLLAARSAAQGADRDFAGRALSVLHAKCGACHGSTVSKPESDFGHVDDLLRLSKDGQLIVPGKPEESRLFRRLAIDRDMPPKGLAKKLGIVAPTPEEINAVREWIAAGAPPPAPRVAAQKQ
jgi:mono/diheme cytochrome c family protein